MGLDAEDRTLHSRQDLILRLGHELRRSVFEYTLHLRMRKLVAGERVCESCNPPEDPRPEHIRKPLRIEAGVVEVRQRKHGNIPAEELSRR